VNRRLLAHLGATRREPGADLRDEPLGRGSTGGEPDGLAPVQPPLVDLADIVHEMSRGSVGASDVDEPLRVRGVGRADDEQQVHLAHELLGGPLPVRGRVTDVLARRPFDAGETAAQHRDDHVRLVDGERRLGDIRKGPLLRERDTFRILHGLDEDDRFRRLAEGALDLLVSFVSDENDGVAGLGIAPRLRVHLRH
jgi:hypothetical protein